MATQNEINTILSSIDATKSCGPDRIPPKIAKMSADILDKTLADIINDIVLNKKFSESAKTANVPPIYKKSDRSCKLNYRPVSLLNIFSKVLERWTKDKMEPVINDFYPNLFLHIGKIIALITRFFVYWKIGKNI